MHKDIQTYNNAQKPEDKAICELLRKIIDEALTEAESKIWHAHREETQKRHISFLLQTPAGTFWDKTSKVNRIYALID